ncbi:MAG: preprotein translocase subunit SecE [Lachnospiraceae bacterium]|nr:preprotein translocase subunit SecE [Lachnospiraceae bacterium]
MADDKNKVSFFKGVKAEFAKITWPDKDDLLKESVAVVCISAVLAALIALFDTAIQYGINFMSTLSF